MEPKTNLEIPLDDEKISFPVYRMDSIVIGSGAAALNAAIHLKENGIDDIMIITDEWGGGTSYNAGSDKQTLYKLSISGKGSDSPLLMAQDLFNGKSMHGELALAEAAGSIEEFFHLIRLGMKFPKNEYGMYAGYQTDNDQRQRATSVGPYTSREMVKCLARRVMELQIPIREKEIVVKLLIETRGAGKRIVGFITFDYRNISDMYSKIPSLKEIPFKIYQAPNVIYATGGPANIYNNSVYPDNHYCSHGLGIEAGAKLRNLAFMQFGLASIKFRWNLSGSYQQVIPAYYSLDAETGEKKEFMREYFPSMRDMAYQVFLKGYHWPFNPLKCDIKNVNHSSLVDLIVFNEREIKGNRVIMDFLRNPWDLTGESFSLAELPEEALAYLRNSNAMQASPIERLEAMNPFAIQVYLDHGIDLHEEPLDVQVAVQHCNGGFAADENWESINIKGLYPVGEVNGSHGQHRPGGAALNSGQVGGLRAARNIAKTSKGELMFKVDEENIKKSVRSLLMEVKKSRAIKSSFISELSNFWDQITNRMTLNGSIIHDLGSLERSTIDAKKSYEKLIQGTVIPGWFELLSYFRCKDACLTHWFILGAMKQQMKLQPSVKPCYITVNDKNHFLEEVLDGNEKIWGTSEQEKNQTLVSWLDNGNLDHEMVDVRPIPEFEDWFETLLKKNQ
ncbi:MAG: FAD-binding protein [Candidatus Hodarchaeota archaeon]